MKFLNGTCHLATLVTPLLLMLGACGGGGGGGGGSTAAAPPPPTISITLSDPSVGQGQVTTLKWSTTNATSCTEKGAWSGSAATSGSLVITAYSVGSASYTLDCTGAGGSVTKTATLNVAVVPNVVSITFDTGTQQSGFNIPFVTVTICGHGTTVCQTIDHVQLDTGSVGLRLNANALSSQTISALAIAIPDYAQVGGPLTGYYANAECAQFASGYLWGSVGTADVKIGGETAPSVPIQVINDPNLISVPAFCAASGAALNLSTIGANGILGIANFTADCGVTCAPLAGPNNYNPLIYNLCNYDGTSPLNTFFTFQEGCAGGFGLALADQVSNPVSAFPTDNNGTLISIQPDTAPVTALSGILTFGIGTESNNQIPTSAQVYSQDTQGNFTTSYLGQSLTASFLDSGSSALFFANSSIPLCAGGSNYYCPTSPLTVTATMVGANGLVNTRQSVTILNVDTNVVAGSTVALPDGASSGSLPGITGFDWGVPFFFGKTVVGAIDGASTPAGPGPYWAF